MIPAPFDYEAAHSFTDAVERLKRHGPEAKLLAGGQSLLPLMKLRLARPAVLVDIGRIEESSFVREEADSIRIGALTRHADLVRSPILRDACPILSHVATLVGDPQVRHQGTIGGAIGHADPSSDVATVLVSLDAHVIVHGPGGVRTAPVAELFAGPYRSTLGHDEVIAEVRVPALTSSDTWAYEKLSARAQGTIVSTAVVLRRRGRDGQVTDVAIALGNMGGVPLRARDAEQILLNEGLEAIPEAARASATGTSPPSDIDGSAAYRRHLATVLARRNLLLAAARGTVS